MQEATLPLSILFQFTSLRSSLDPAGYLFPIQWSTKVAWTWSLVAHCCNLMGCSQRTSLCAQPQEWKHLKKIINKVIWKEAWTDGGGGTVPKVFTHNFCCYGNLCPYLFRATASFQAISIVLLWERGTSCGDISTSKKWGGREGKGHDGERRRVFKHAFTRFLLLQDKIWGISVCAPPELCWSIYVQPWYK